MKQKDFPEKTAIWRAFMLLLLFAFLQIGELGAQSTERDRGAGACGGFKKLGGVPESYVGEIYYDRFGNTWTGDEISGLASNVIEECNAGAGVFTLSFSGSYTSAERDQVCAALSSLSAIVGGGGPSGIVPLKIEFVNNVDGNGAAASQFMQAQCGMMKNFALLNIRTQTNQLPANFFAGLIQIDSDPDWYTGPMPANLNDWNTNHAGQVDLFTAVLHEGMHILGVASTFGGAELTGGNVIERYTDWDRFLYQRDGANYIKLIEPANDPLCCSKHQKNPAAPTTFPSTCDANILFRDGPTNIAEVSYNDLVVNDVSSTNNRLSHLDIACSPDPNAAAYQYVMHPGIPPSPDLYSYPRRVLTQAELDILCRLGYSAVGGCQYCVTVAEDDYYPKVIFLSGSNPNNPAFLEIGPYVGSFSLLGNDVLPAGASIELCGHDPEITVEVVGSTVKVTGFTPGNWSFCYKLNSDVPNCSDACDEATVHVTVLQAPIYTNCVDNNCNLLCFGTFELFPTGLSTYYSALDMPEFYFTDLSHTMRNTPDIHLQTDVVPPNKVIRWVRSTDLHQDQESVRLPLSQPILAGCTVTIHYQAAAAKLASLISPLSSMRMEVYGLTAPPCTAIANQPAWGGEGAANPLCTGVTAYGMDQNLGLSFDADVQGSPASTTNLTLADYTFTYTHPDGAPPITDLLVWGTFTPTGPDGEGLEFYMDNVTVTSSCNSQINITPTIVSQCIGGQAVITYEVCLLGSGTDPVTINLQAQLPPGLTVVTGGDFDADGLASFPLIPGTQCNGGNNTTTITLTLDVSPNFDPAQAPIPVTIPLEILGGNLCIDPTIGDGGDVTLLLQDCSPEVGCQCPDNSGYVVGENMDSETILSMSDLPVKLENTCLTVNGRLVVDVDCNISGTQVIMNRGAEIVVKLKAKLEVTNFSYIEGCAHMWRGITVENGGTLVMTHGNNISDAQWAVKALDGATLEITENNFLQDYGGIYVPASATGGAQTVNLVALTGNEFACWGPLKPAYTIAGDPDQEQVPIPGLHTYVGISLNDVAGFDIGADNKFDETRNAVFALRSSFTMDQCVIRNLVADPVDLNALYYYNLDQHGVYADYCPLAEITNCTFFQFGKGIFSQATNLTADGNTMSGFHYDSPGDDIGIDCGLNTNRSVRIRHNTISMWGIGILVTNASPATILRIKDNHMTMYPGSSGAHIDLQTINGGMVMNNIMTRSDASATGTGLQLLNCQSIIVQDNIMTGLERGTLTSGCVSNIFTSNDAVGGGSTGYYAFSSTDTYCANTSQGQDEYGFYFRGMCIKNNGFRCNRLGDAGINGLRLWAFGMNSTKIGTQYNGGNVWNGSYGSWGAYNESIVAGDILASKFTLLNSQLPTWSTGIGQTAQWFKGAILPDNNCLFACPVYVDTDEGEFPTGGGGGGFDPGEEDEKSALGGHNGAGFNWMARQRLYERLCQDPASATENPSIQRFYATAPATDLGQLYEVGRDLALLQGRDVKTWAAMGAIQKEIAERSSALQALRAKGPGKDYSTWWPQVQLLQQQIRLATDRLNGHEKWINERRQAEASAILAKNAAVIPTNICALNQQTVNAIYLHNALWNDNLLSASTLQQIKAIADQCPLDGGFAVYEARSMYRRFVPLTNWNPDLDCSKSDVNADNGERKWAAFSLVPNPADESLWITSNSKLDQEAQFELFNITGKTVARMKLMEGNNPVPLDIKALPAGMYFYKIQGKGSMLQNGKLS